MVGRIKLTHLFLALLSNGWKIWMKMERAGSEKDGFKNWIWGETDVGIKIQKNCDFFLNWCGH